MKAIDKEKVVKLLKKYALDKFDPNLYNNAEDLAEQIMKCEIYSEDKPLIESVHKRPRIKK